jgi:RNA recognition motif-containing protein
MRIYVGNLAYAVNEEDLRQAFAAFGQVESVNVITDRESGRSKGFGFVEMPVAEEGQAAITGLNGKELKGRAVNVSEARPRADRGDAGGRGGRDNRGGGGRRW